MKEIVQARCGAQPGEKTFIVLGDLNDYLETDEAGSSGIRELVEWDQVENVVERRPTGGRWTHYFREQAAPKKDSYQQLDYMLLARSLAAKTPAIPDIVRTGLTRAADRYTGPRFPEVGDPKPAASDYCPVAIDVML